MMHLDGVLLGIAYKHKQTRTLLHIVLDKKSLFTTDVKNAYKYRGCIEYKIRIT